MKHTSPLDESICSILTQYKRIAVVGLSDKSWRASNRVAGYLLEQGYVIIPVNPDVPEVFGIRSSPDLISAPRPIEVVDIFRQTQFIPEIVDQAILACAKAIWMQSGLIDEISAERARHAGLQVVMDRCLMVEHSLHMGQNGGDR